MALLVQAVEVAGDGHVDLVVGDGPELKALAEPHERLEFLEVNLLRLGLHRAAFEEAHRLLRDTRV
jgi:hypothetical protein